MRRGAAQIVEQHGMHTVGIYREPGVKSRYEGRLRGFFNKCPTHIISLDEDRVDIKDVASLLKLYATRGLLGGGAGAVGLAPFSRLAEHAEPIVLTWLRWARFAGTSGSSPTRSSPQSCMSSSSSSRLQPAMRRPTMRWARSQRWRKECNN